MMNPEENTCFFCCKWKEGPHELYICETCKLDKRMLNYHFLLCRECLAEHSKNHQNPKSQLWDKTNLRNYIIANGNNTDI